MHGVPAAAQDDLPLKVGDLAGDYRIERHLADGGMASVYAARHPIIGKHAAVKVLRSAMSRDSLQTERFLREARAVNTIQHPNIVDIFAFGQLEDGRQFLVMEHLPGETLFARLWSGRLELKRALPLLLEIVDALDAAHSNHIAHLDLKPENIFLVPFGKKTTVKLLDFGIAKLFGGESSEGRDEFVGTPDYASPEQACASPSIDHRSDVYSLGVVAYEVLTGALPLQGPTPLATLAKHLDEMPAPPSVHVDLPGELNRLVVRMLEKDAAARPSLAEVRDVLEHVLETSTTPSVSVPVVVEAPPHRRHASALRLAGVAIAASLALAFGLAHRAGAVASNPPAEIASQSAPRFADTRVENSPTVQATVAPVTTVPQASARTHRRRLRAVPAGVDYVLGYDGNRL